MFQLAENQSLFPERTQTSEPRKGLPWRNQLCSIMQLHYQ